MNTSLHPSEGELVVESHFANGRIIRSKAPGNDVDDIDVELLFRAANHVGTVREDIDYLRHVAPTQPVYRMIRLHLDEHHYPSMSPGDSVILVSTTERRELLCANFGWVTTATI
jgi:hypothetical protein